MIELIVAGAILFQPASAALIVTQDPTPSVVASQDPVELEDVIVTGRPLRDLIGDFVDEVAEPNRRRGLARWSRSICVGVANLERQAAQYVVDRISTVAEDVGVRPGAPGCTPNLLIVATTDGGELAQALVTQHPRAFRLGGSGMDRGGAALREFVGTERPVRWWQVSMPTDSETGQRAVRLPGDCFPISACAAANGSVMAYAPKIEVFAASRLKTQIVDNIFRTIVLIDVDDVSHLSAQQLADYIAMISLAQIDPNADTSTYASILNVFDSPGSSQSLTSWDNAYLRGLYGAERNDANRRAGRTEIETSILRAHHELKEGEETEN